MLLRTQYRTSGTELGYAATSSSISPGTAASFEEDSVKIMKVYAPTPALRVSPRPYSPVPTYHMPLCAPYGTSGTDYALPDRRSTTGTTR
eukprot:896694-Rhodomonas_salina.3